jgi:putative ATP-dependent endonuclease of the OLD family
VANRDKHQKLPDARKSDSWVFQGVCTISGRNNAGKSGIIRLLTNVFGENRNRPWDIKEFDYKEDKTQWAKEPSQI